MGGANLFHDISGLEFIPRGSGASYSPVDVKKRHMEWWEKHKGEYPDYRDVPHADREWDFDMASIGIRSAYILILPGRITTVRIPIARREVRQGACQHGTR